MRGVALGLCYSILVQVSITSVCWGSILGQMSITSRHWGSILGVYIWSLGVTLVKVENFTHGGFG